MHLFQTFVEEEYPPDQYRYDIERAEAIPTGDILNALSNMQRVIGSNLLELSKIYGIELDDSLTYNFKVSNDTDA